MNLYIEIIDAINMLQRIDYVLKQNYFCYYYKKRGTEKDVLPLDMIECCANPQLQMKDEEISNHAVYELQTNYKYLYIVIDKIEKIQDNINDLWNNYPECHTEYSPEYKQISELFQKITPSLRKVVQELSLDIKHIAKDSKICLKDYKENLHHVVCIMYSSMQKAIEDRISYLITLIGYIRNQFTIEISDEISDTDK